MIVFKATGAKRGKLTGVDQITVVLFSSNHVDKTCISELMNG